MSQRDVSDHVASPPFERVRSGRGSAGSRSSLSRSRALETGTTGIADKIVVPVPPLVRRRLASIHRFGVGLELTGLSVRGRCDLPEEAQAEVCVVGIPTRDLVVGRVGTCWVSA